LIIRSIAQEVATQRIENEDDVVLAREASAFYLKLSESLLAEIPENGPLAAAVAGGYTQYAFAFVQLEAERTEMKDAKAAQRLRERARRLYQRANRHAMSALERQTPGFGKALASSERTAWPQLQDDQIAVAYWAAASWAGLISLSKDDPDMVADLPLAIRLAQMVWSIRPDFGEGAIASLMGSLEAARPGGSARQAATYFDQAIAMGKGKSAGVFVAKAEGVALVAGDRQGFEELLHMALTASGARRDLHNMVMRERAQWLLEIADDLF
jgi:predicted anti-sigma-YlaC factor YlaD